MDGKLLVLCDETLGEYKHYKVRDAYYLLNDYYDPEDNSNIIFVNWKSVIPDDVEFLERCKHYARTYEEVPADFMYQKKGVIDQRYANVGDSIQERSYYDVLLSNTLSVHSAIANEDEDYQALAIDLACEFPFQATQRFLEDFSSVLKKNGIVRILLAYKTSLDYDTIRRRASLLDAWKNQNRFMREKMSNAEIAGEMSYDDFGKVYTKAQEEMLKVYSLPIFGPTRK